MMSAPFLWGAYTGAFVVLAIEVVLLAKRMRKARRGP
jgi:hypothetical protein